MDEVTAHTAGDDSRREMQSACSRATRERAPTRGVKDMTEKRAAI